MNVLFYCIALRHKILLNWWLEVESESGGGENFRDRFPGVANFHDDQVWRTSSLKRLILKKLETSFMSDKVSLAFRDRSLTNRWWLQMSNLHSIMIETMPMLTTNWNIETIEISCFLMKTLQGCTSVQCHLCGSRVMKFWLVSMSSFR